MTTKCARWPSYFVPLTYCGKWSCGNWAKYFQTLFANAIETCNFQFTRRPSIKLPRRNSAGTQLQRLQNANKLICGPAATFATRTPHSNELCRLIRAKNWHSVIENWLLFICEAQTCPWQLESAETSVRLVPDFLLYLTAISHESNKFLRQPPPPPPFLLFLFYACGEMCELPEIVFSISFDPFGSLYEFQFIHWCQKTFTYVPIGRHATNLLLINNHIIIIAPERGNSK